MKPALTMFGKTKIPLAASPRVLTAGVELYRVWRRLGVRIDALGGGRSSRARPHRNDDCRSKPQYEDDEARRRRHGLVSSLRGEQGRNRNFPSAGRSWGRMPIAYFLRVSLIPERARFRLAPW